MFLKWSLRANNETTQHPYRLYIYIFSIYIYTLGHIVTWWTLWENKCWFIRNPSQRSLNRFTLSLYSNRYCVIRMVVVNPDLYDRTIQKSQCNPKLVWFVRPTGAQDLLVHKPPATRTFKVPKMHQILFSPILFRKWLEEVAFFFHPVSEDLVKLLLFFVVLKLNTIILVNTG